MMSGADWPRCMKNTRWIKAVRKCRMIPCYTKQAVADKLAAYLRREILLAQLVDWAENAMMEGEFAEQDMPALRAVVSRLGVADVRAFGLSREDCQQFLGQLGFAARVDVVAA